MPVDPADVPTIYEILSEYIDPYVLQESEFVEMIDRLKERESIMIADRGN
jgi:hypothetical protein